jgi:hypothetical protein
MNAVFEVKPTLDEIVWVDSQAVIGDPSLPRLRAAPADAGFEVLELNLSNDGEDLSFAVRVTELVGAQVRTHCSSFGLPAFEARAIELATRRFALPTLNATSSSVTLSLLRWRS